MTYPKRTTDLEVGDVVAMYGARDRVVEVLKVNREARYTAVSVMMEPVGRAPLPGAGEKRFVCFDNTYVHVELPKGYKVVAVPEEA